MQPRNLFPPLLETVFHVTNSGESSTVEMLVALLASLTPLGVELALCRLDELPVAGEARSRDIAAGFAPLGEKVPLAGGDCKGSVVVGSSVYFAHKASTSRSESCGRFSRLAERLSKQYAQWAWLAISRLS
jgi:hypothetical protein